MPSAKYVSHGQVIDQINKIKSYKICTKVIKTMNFKKIANKGASLRRKKSSKTKFWIGWPKRQNFRGQCFVGPDKTRTLKSQMCVSFQMKLLGPSNQLPCLAPIRLLPKENDNIVDAQAR